MIYLHFFFFFVHNVPYKSHYYTYTNVLNTQKMRLHRQQIEIITAITRVCCELLPTFI